MSEDMEGSLGSSRWSYKPGTSPLHHYFHLHQAGPWLTSSKDDFGLKYWWGAKGFFPNEWQQGNPQESGTCRTKKNGGKGAEYGKVGRTKQDCNVDSRTMEGSLGARPRSWKEKNSQKDDWCNRHFDFTIGGATERNFGVTQHKNRFFLSQLSISLLSKDLSSRWSLICCKAKRRS